MSPKMPFSPRIYWLIYTLLFFFLSQCSFTKSLLRKGGSESASQAVLWNKYPKKLNAKFYSEGSSYYRFIERNGSQSGLKIADWEITFLVFDKDFLTSVKAAYPQTEEFQYKLIWRKKTGTYTLTENKKDFTASFTLLESGAEASNDLSDLLNKLGKTKSASLSISEMASFFVEGTGAYQTSETIQTSVKSSYEWKNELPSSETSPPRSVFLFTNGSGDKTTKFSSPHYDFFQLQFEVSPTEPNKLFYKSIYADSKFEIYFLPPLANNLTTKPKEPVGLKRIGDYLLKEETP
ncbi:hypothetical protein [Leptospira ognonensis]|uniref:hypothetical protein n=1 Tax=Leptospira ognonensis TaxID=2484945 RepID=UPI0010826262|nr:hypothetical protein [Leptospira ognonensis]